MLVRKMGALSILALSTVLLGFVLLFLTGGSGRGSFKRGGTSISGPVYFIIIAIGLLMFLADIGASIF